MTDTILLIADSTDLVPFADALSVRGFMARGVSLAGLPPGLDLAEVRAIVLCDSAEPHARAVTRLLQVISGAPLPVIVALPDEQRTQRDACLIAGAGDVAVGAHPDDVAGRVDSAVHGWSRGSPRRKLRAALKAQRGRQMIDLQTVDIDPSGLGIVPIANLPAGSLLRTNLMLPDGEMLTWGRLASADDGSPGIRFVALMPEERQRIVSAIRTKPVPTATSPGMTPAVVGFTPPVPERTGSPAAGVVITSSSVLPPPPLPAPAAAPATSATGADLIADAIGEMLGEPGKDGSEAAAVPVSPDPAAVQPGLAGNIPGESRKWPTVTYQIEAAQNVLAQACSLGLASDEEGAPPGERVLEFVRTLTTVERRAFDADPPPELPDPPLARKCLAMRLRLFALTQEAAEIPLDPGAQLSIDDELLSQLNLETKGINGDLQKELDRFVAAAQTQRIKEVNTFRNALTRGASDLRSALGRLRGEVVDGRANAVLLDVEEKNESAQQPLARRDAPRDVEKKEEHAVFAPETAAAKEARRKWRIRVWLILFVLSAGAGVYAFLHPWKNRLMTAEEYRDVVDISEVNYDPHRNHATILVNAKWRPDPSHLQPMEQFIKREAFDTYVVLNDKHEAMAIGRKGKPMTVVRAHSAQK